ncbi:MAG: DUF523 and DUF1722 domain-containing protein [Candidatus Eisenbacteria bacterium]|nr:DUF523 and DUF1722 domain-containing protein [Candidatus Eisenbacteria bacterium]
MNDHRKKIPIGVSRCLLGDPVRFDGGHKRSRFLTDVLAEWFRFVPVCPEVEIGLGVPRESIRLVRSDSGPRLVGSRTGKDRTEKMNRFTEERAEGLAPLRLRGFVLKSTSPTCGFERVRIYDTNGVPTKDARGFWGGRLMDRFPLLPIEDEGRLNDPRIRENFIVRLFTYDRWLRLREGTVRPRDLVDFHTAHKMLVLAHSPKAMTEMGRLTARAGADPMEDLLDRYEAEMMTGLRKIASPGKHVNVLEHFAGFLKKGLDRESKAELHDLIGEYGRGWVPLITPLSLLRHHLRRLGHEWVEAQVYLRPYPRELALRSTI